MVTAEICETLYVYDSRGRPPPPPCLIGPAPCTLRVGLDLPSRPSPATIQPHPGPNPPFGDRGGRFAWSTVDHNQVVPSDKYLPVALAAIDPRIRADGGLCAA